MRVFFVIGTRPEIIKMAPVIHECEKRSIEHFVLHTGQHYSDNMSKAFFDDLSLKAPDKNLNIGSGSHSEQTAKALLGIEKELLSYKPDVVLVQGDTNAVLSATIVAVKLHIPVGHIEAGLRSNDVRMPEEHNRRLTDHASAFLFAPTEETAETLRGEKVWGRIFVTGNTVIDALEKLIPEAEERIANSKFSNRNNFVLLTMHRAENVDDKKTLTGIIEGLISLDEEILFLAHPRTVSRLEEFNLMEMIKNNSRIEILEPVSYLIFLGLMKRAKYILTDSGGIQEEVTAPSINRRAFVLRTSTERPEAVSSGHVSVVGVNPKEFPTKIKEYVDKGLDVHMPGPYGDGLASERILDILVDYI
ncbi:MAG: UDP-N-acetylglucosamine 2-epimerase (non-hydrolyzing) [Candidatus Thorarchaeota archaeon]|nr:UDP-N-acetylglucosamine 2-epimerase (non-hydrolyzing) [Candidatus Thorarchaeota archaeon]